MTVNYIPFEATGYFSKVICDYLVEKQELQQFYNRFPNLENFQHQIQEKQKTFNASKRAQLVKTLIQQYSEVASSKKTLDNIDLLLKDNTFTITTGHQLNLFTGPLYFIYKILTAINLSEQLSVKYPEYNFIPIYWMATEDHDFEEINYFNFEEEKIKWERKAAGAVGELKTKGFKELSKLFKERLGAGDNAKFLFKLFKEAYVKHDTLTEATRFLANELFKEYGLVIVDGNNSDLKRLFIPHIKDELINQTGYKSVSKTSEKLKSVASNYKIQVNPREINLFYLKKKLRERIIYENGLYKVLNTEITFTKDALLDEINNYPERFSPNVIMRPLYQEVILPNLCYIGGGGELAYWFQLKLYFNQQNIPFPILLLRNSVLIITDKESWKLEQFNIGISDLFLKQQQLELNKLKELSDISIDFSRQKRYLSEQFEYLHKLAKLTDKSFLGAVAAQERKQIKGLEHLEKRLIKAQKRVHNDELSRLKSFQNILFPKQSLQERQVNFSSFFLEYGSEFIPMLKQALNPLHKEFVVLTI